MIFRRNYKMVQGRRKSRALLILLCVPGLSACLNSVIYPAPGYPVPSPPERLREIALRTTAGDTVVAWEYEIAGGPDSRRAPVILYLHGNGENLGMMLVGDTLEILMGLEVNFAALDYPGYGRSSGTPTLESVTAGGQALLRYLAKRYPGNALIIVGHSLGTGVALQLARREPGRFAGLILFSPFTSLRDAAAVHFTRCLAWSLPLENYDSLSIARNIRVPVLLVHGQDDGIIPATQGRRLARAFAGPTSYVELPNVGHNDIVRNPQTQENTKRFLEQFF